MKKFWIVVGIVGVVIFLGYIGKDMDLSKIGENNGNTAASKNIITAKNNTSNNTKTTENNTTNNTSNNAKNEANNTTNEANATNESNTTNTTNSTENTTSNTTDNQTKTVEVVTVSDEDKAIDLAKKAYGSSDGVYFKVEQIESNGIYIISVRDTETTSALSWYNVNVKTGSVN